tara:strand:- start:1164 stop:1667 length:504 start_codon:yes stop_codon:yes gene_type:complete
MGEKTMSIIDHGQENHDQKKDYRIDLIELGHWQTSEISVMSKTQLEKIIQDRESGGWQLIGKPRIEVRGFGKVTWYSAEMRSFVPLKSDPSYGSFWIRFLRVISAIFFVFFLIVGPSMSGLVYCVVILIIIPFILQQFVDKVSVKKFRMDKLQSKQLEDSFNERINQ